MEIHNHFCVSIITCDVVHVPEHLVGEGAVVRACTDGDLETVQVGLLYAMFMMISSIMKTVLYTRLLGMT